MKRLKGLPIKLGRQRKTYLAGGPFSGQAWLHHERGPTLEFVIVTQVKGRPMMWRGRYLNGKWYASESMNESRWVEQQFKEERTA